MFDAKGGVINEVKDHRMYIDGFYYWIIRINRRDAEERGLATGDLVKAFNDRGAVILAAQVTDRLPPGVVHACEGSAIYEPIGEPGSSPDRGGCINTLTPSRNIIKRSHSTASNSCLVEVAPWRAAGETR
jgi:trimethylamine-N-oxide reductase (cytochrome c)